MIYNYDSIPIELKQLKRWVLWKKKPTKDGRTTKIPINAHTGYGAKSNDEETWTTFEHAMIMCDSLNCDGLGFMLGNGFFGVDLDNHGEMSDDEFKELRKEFLSCLTSYAEVSQSGVGLHIICKGVLPQGARRRGNIEMYDSARFFAMTGKGNKLPVNERTNEIKKLWEKYLNKEDKYVFTRDNAPSTGFNLLSDEEVLDKARESKNGSLFTCLYYGQWQGIYESQSQADLSLCNILAFWCAKDNTQMDRIFRSSKLMRDKWDEKRGEQTYGELTISQAVNNCKETFTSSFDSSKKFYNPLTGEVEDRIKKNYDLTDTGNAQRFIDKFGDNLRYNFDNKAWMTFDGKTWIRDNKQLVKTQVDILIDEMKKELASEENKELAREMARNVKHLSSNSGKEAMLKEAMHIGAMPTTNADYDKSEYYLNCKNGVVDLHNGDLLAHDKVLMLSKNTNIECDMENEPTRRIQFLHEIFSNDEGLIDYVQKAVGYTLTGDTKEQCFFQCYGDGANGKSVFLDIIYNMLGTYSLNSQVESILAKNTNSSGASSEIARMNGARFVRTNEPNDGSRFNEGLVKQLVSGDVTTARFLYGNEFEFVPVFKLWIATNYKIEVRGTDYGIWRRMRLIPFKQKFEGKKMDKDLTNKLMKELPQILGRAVEGCIKWQEEGLHMPDIIESETKQYQVEMDKLGKFVEDCCKIDLTARERAGDLYKEYAERAKNGHEYCMTQTRFGIEMQKRFIKKNIGGYAYYMGLKLKKNDRSYTYEKDNI